MDAAIKTAIWRQFGASIDTLNNAMNACPDHLWRADVWPNPAPIPERAQVWYILFHALFWLDLYLDGAEEGFLPPAPFSLIEQDDEGPTPERIHSKAELQTYLDACRQKCKATIDGLTEQASERHCVFGWGECSFFELLLYNMRHVQEHATQVNLFLGQQGVAVEDYVTQTR